MTELCRIMNENGSDKGSGWHNYTILYEGIFSKKRLDKLNIFELGLGTNNIEISSNMGPNGKPGASLRGWKEYFTNSDIYGADIDKDILFEEDRIKTFYCDQLNKEDILNMWKSTDLIDKEFDIIIDDGLHEFEANISFFENSIHKLRRGGLFIIEDIHQISLRKFKDKLPDLINKFNNFSFELKEIPNTQNQGDNNILIIKHLDESPKLINNLENHIENKRVIDCFTFYNELEVLELRLTELYDVVDKFIIVEAEKTHKGENKRFIFEENKWRFEKWLDKVIHIKVYYPSHINDPWGREKFQRNSFMPTLYTLGLNDNDVIFITDVDEILNPERVNYIKTSYDLKETNKMEMITYFGNFYNKQDFPKWYHPKVVNWGTLKTTTPDDCRLNFNCQWWENGGWHLTYFGGTERIINKLENFAHQEYNKEEFKNPLHIEKSISEGRDIFGEWRKFERIEPEENPDLPLNWKILSGIDNKEPYKNTKKRNLVLGTAIGLSGEDVIRFVKSFRKFNENDDVFLIINIFPKPDLISVLNEYNIKTLSSSFNTVYNKDFNINIHRFYKYLDFLEENNPILNKNTYEKILITDVTDVVFQSDPFNIDTKEEFIIFAEEYSEEMLCNNSFNSRWVSITFGDEVLDRIGNNPIVCAGTTLGSARNIMKYLKSMVLIMSEKIEANVSISMESIDQGVHNYIVRTRNLLFKNIDIKPSGDFIATIGIICQKESESIEIKDDHIEVYGKKPSIVHQYNRSEKITHFYKSKYNK